MSEVIENGDPLWDKVMAAWWREGRPTNVQVGDLVFRDIGDEKFVIIRRANDDMSSSYGSRSVNPEKSADITAPGEPTRFRPIY